MSLHDFPGQRGVSDIRMRRRRHKSPRGEPTGRRRLLVSASFTTAMFLSPVATKSSGGVAALRAGRLPPCLQHHTDTQRDVLVPALNGSDLIASSKTGAGEGSLGWPINLWIRGISEVTGSQNSLVNGC
ncbi:uncharacterized protein [Lolium perenne]|uniref:uncharacterized protein isoform X2 n=1 Tax=Lolium perenne TaxID=4522 RepID=UPI003A9A3E1B